MKSIWSKLQMYRISLWLAKGMQHQQIVPTIEVLSLGVEGKVSKQKLLEVERKLEQLNKTPVKSIQDDASQRTGCFNLVCAEFVQTSHEVAFGAAMAATSS
ncbi:hypothetical protein Scep_021770 [Stephania cephalantha]|uniref:Neprosin PEP catalytic domain-containing protein n=1 Tax=Stephania cephalantha TaxID=152367 RepID=A0AAP0I1N2_9MAGN